ncbi:MAG: tRNA glutamyl-Q synthetase [Puniceicoccales bacterium]|jgi:glutamyl-tRNA synthetase|nr:tRNA glutamyl-Q synthetase [Puniceicoccales bacterium]
MSTAPPYRGRLAPTPTGFLHLGHAATFSLAAQRAAAAGGALVMRVEDLDPLRCKPEFAAAALEDLRWLGLRWDEGPDVGGPFAPYTQSERREWFLEVWRRLRDAGAIYPCSRSRRDVALAALAPNEPSTGGAGGDAPEPLFPPEWRPPAGTGSDVPAPDALDANWRFRVPDGRRVCFTDGRLGERAFTAGADFGDFVVWRRDNVPAYELAVVADDHAMRITEVVRGEDLLLSTARQLLLYEALGWTPPAWFHAPLVRDAAGRRLAKRDNARSLRSLREQGLPPPVLTPRGADGIRERRAGTQV